MKKHPLITGPLWIWLCVLLVLYVFEGLNSILTFTVSTMRAVLTLVFCLAMAAGSALLLFKAEKTGFYLITAAAAVSCAVSLLQGGGVLYSVAGSVIIPLITYALMRPKWDSFHDR